MLIGDTPCRAPQLSYRDVHMPAIAPHLKTITDRPHYALTLDIPICGEHQSYSLLIRCYWDSGVWCNEYYFGQYDMGEFEEILPPEVARERREAYLLNEGNLEGFNYPRLARGIEKDIVKALIRRWEAMCELVTPHVTL